MDANLGSSCQEHDLGIMAPGLWPQDMAQGYGPSTTLAPFAQRFARLILCSVRGAHILRGNEARLEILRLRARQTRPRQGCGPGGAALPMEGLQRPRPLPRPHGTWARGPVPATVPRSRARVQRLLQLLRRHER